MRRGHIHDTFLVESQDMPIAVMQRVNRTVFRDPQALITNAEAVEPFVRDRVAARIPARAGKACVIDEAGDYWRAFAHLGPSLNLDLPQSTAQCFAAGEAFGGFQAALANLSPEQLCICIDGFQDFAVAASRFELAIKSDACGRLSSSVDFADALVTRKGQAPMLSGPFGIVHGDCKFNNVQFDASGERVIAVLDLDTVMWHRRALDFGDLVRAGAVLGAEDDTEAEIDLARVSAFAAGFRTGAGALAPERQALFDALLHVTLMLTLRFYGDHLNGDVYFQVEAPGDNLRRACGQWALFEQAACRRKEVLRALK
ncbi:MAG: phosphotransferase [Gammaproteobacteria bacterium]|nr:phosphotransferase [Gammaproteobacteria bacterium]